MSRCSTFSNLKDGQLPSIARQDLAVPALAGIHASGTQPCIAYGDNKSCFHADQLSPAFSPFCNHSRMLPEACQIESAIYCSMGNVPIACGGPTERLSEGTTLHDPVLLSACLDIKTTMPQVTDLHVNHTSPTPNATTSIRYGLR